jgi:hypothetical protein
MLRVHYEPPRGRPTADQREDVPLSPSITSSPVSSTMTLNAD